MKIFDTNISSLFRILLSIFFFFFFLIQISSLFQILINEESVHDSEIIEEKEETYLQKVILPVQFEEEEDVSDFDIKEVKSKSISKVEEIEKQYSDSDIGMEIPRPNTAEWDAWIKKQIMEIEEEEKDEISPNEFNEENEDKEKGTIEPILHTVTMSHASSMSISDSPQLLLKSHNLSDFEEDYDLED